MANALHHHCVVRVQVALRLARSRSLELQDLQAAFRLFGVELTADEFVWENFKEVKLLGHYLVPMELASGTPATQDSANLLKFPSGTTVSLFGEEVNISKKKFASLLSALSALQL